MNDLKYDGKRYTPKEGRFDLSNLSIHKILDIKRQKT